MRKNIMSLLIIAIIIMLPIAGHAAYSVSDFNGASEVDETSSGLVVHYNSLKDLDCDLSITFDKDRNLIFKFYNLEVMKNKTVEFKSNATRTDLEKMVDKALSSSDYSKIIDQKRGLLGGVLGKLPVGAKYHMAIRSINGSHFALQLVLEATRKEGARTVSVAVSNSEIKALLDD